MKRFDPNADCPKCGGDGFDPKYMPAVDLLRVECDICGYIANQFPLDRPDESASQGFPHGEGTTQEAPESGQAPQPAGSGADLEMPGFLKRG